MNPSPYLDDINVIRVVVLTETSPQSDSYYQMEFTEEQYIKLLDYLQKNCTEPDPEGGFSVPIADNILVRLPEKINAHLPKDVSVQGV